MRQIPDREPHITLSQRCSNASEKFKHFIDFIQKKYFKFSFVHLSICISKRRVTKKFVFPAETFANTLTHPLESLESGVEENEKIFGLIIRFFKN